MVLCDNEKCKTALSQFPPLLRFKHMGLNLCVGCTAKIRIDPQDFTNIQFIEWNTDGPKRVRKYERE